MTPNLRSTIRNMVKRNRHKGGQRFKPFSYNMRRVRIALRTVNEISKLNIGLSNMKSKKKLQKEGLRRRQY